jgi:hypothetical protein
VVLVHAGRARRALEGHPDHRLRPHLPGRHGRRADRRLPDAARMAQSLRWTWAGRRPPRCGARSTASRTRSTSTPSTTRARRSRRCTRAPSRRAATWIPGAIDPAANGRSQKDGEQLMAVYQREG